MDKLNLHDSLRIYLPGLLFSLLLYWISFGTLNEAGNTIIPAIFVGFLLDAPLTKIQRVYFDNMVERKLLDLGFSKQPRHVLPAFQALIAEQLQKQSPTHADKLRECESDKVRTIIRLFLNRSYSTESLLVFRGPKSIGVLCFNSSIVCLIVAIYLVVQQIYPIAPIYNLPAHGFGFIVADFLIASSLTFILSGQYYFEYSLKMEYAYWATLTLAELTTLIGLIDMCENQEKDCIAVSHEETSKRGN